MRILIITSLIFLALFGSGVYLKTNYTEAPVLADIEIPIVESSTSTTANLDTPTSTPVTATETTPTITITPPSPTTPNPAVKPVKITAGDHAAPSPLSGLEVSTDDHIVELSWVASQDNVGVKGYRIYRDKKLIGTTIETFYAEANVSTPSTHTYTVYAFDAAGNTSSGLSIIPSDEEDFLGSPIAVVTAPTEPTPAPTTSAPSNTTPSAPTPAPSTPTPSVNPTPAPTPAPTVTVTATPASIAYNTTTKISWSSTNATSCSSAGGGGNGTSGSFTTPALLSNSSYSVTCSGAGGNKTGSVSVSVAAAPAPAPAPAPTALCGKGGSCTAADIAPHNTRGDCWVYLSPLNKAYNISAYVANGNKHPGGDVIVPYCGSNIYNYFIGTAGGHKHSSSALNSVLQAYYIGVFQP